MAEKQAACAFCPISQLVQIPPHLFILCLKRMGFIPTPFKTQWLDFAPSCTLDSALSSLDPKDSMVKDFAFNLNCG